VLPLPSCHLWWQSTSPTPLFESLGEARIWIRWEFRGGEDRVKIREGGRLGEIRIGRG
jgi:hypothetical protein